MQEAPPTISEIKHRHYTGWRSSINLIPVDLSLLSQSCVPFAVTVSPLGDAEDVHSIDEYLDRCGKCRAYINPYVEMIPPGALWKCNMCLTVNMTKRTYVPMKQLRSSSGIFNPSLNKANNAESFSNAELRQCIVDVPAPSCFSTNVSSQHVIFFLIEATKHAASSGMLRTALGCIVGNVEVIPGGFDRARIVLAFFNSSVYVINSIANDKIDFVAFDDPKEMPLISRQDLMIKKSEVGAASIIDDTVEFFSAMGVESNDLGSGIRVMQSVLGSQGGTAFVFIGSAPNEGDGKIDAKSDTIKCESSFYKDRCQELIQSSVCVNYFVMADSQIGLPTFSILSKFTGGSVNYYPGYSRKDGPYFTKLVTDYVHLLEQGMGADAACKVRVNKGATVEKYWGSLSMRSGSVISFANLYGSHNFTFEIHVESLLPSTEFTIQVAVVRTIESGEKRIRIMNFSIPIVSASPAAFYERLDASEIAHVMVLRAMREESREALAGRARMVTELTKLLRSYNSLCGGRHSAPPPLAALPLLVSSAMKGVPFRHAASVPADERYYRMYLFFTQCPYLVDTMIYPSLYSLRALTDEADPSPINLTLNLLDLAGFYLLDTGVDMFFFAGRECPRSVVDGVVSHPATGRFSFEQTDTPIGRRVYSLVKKLRDRRSVSPNYYVVRDVGGDDPLVDRFFGYFLDDECHGLPSFRMFLKSLRDKVSSA